MATESELRCKIGKLEKSYEDACDNNARIQAQIEALNEALASVRQAKSHAGDLKRSLKALDPSRTWKGKRRRGFDNARKGDLADESQAYWVAIDDLEQSILRKIRSLRSEMNGLALLIKTISSGIDHASRDLQSLLQKAFD